MAESLEAMALREGIPLKMMVDDELRYSDCDAHMADLTGIEGTVAIYKGECNVGHHYDMRREINEIRQQAQISGGKIVIGDDKGFVAPGAETEPEVKF